MLVRWRLVRGWRGLVRRWRVRERLVVLRRLVVGRRFVVARRLLVARRFLVGPRFVVGRRLRLRLMRVGERIVARRLVFGQFVVVQLALVRRRGRFSFRIRGLVLGALLVLVLFPVIGPVVGVEFGRLELLGRAPDRAKGLAFGALDLGWIGAPATLQLEVFANCVIQQTHAYSLLGSDHVRGVRL